MFKVFMEKFGLFSANFANVITQLSSHKSIIEGWKKCVFCEKTYRLENSLYMHVQMTHSKPKNYECETCTHTLFWLLLQKVQKIRILKFQNSYSKLFSTLPVHSRDPKNQPYFISNPIQLPAELTKVE